MDNVSLRGCGKFSRLPDEDGDGKVLGCDAVLKKKISTRRVRTRLS